MSHRRGCRAELGYAQSVGINAVRVFLSMLPWVADRQTFLARYDHFIQACAAKDVKPLIVLFDDDFFEVPGVNSTADVAPWLATKEYKTSKWMANPGMFLLAEDAAQGWKQADAYLADIAGGSRANDKRLLGFDVMNEPGRKAPFPGGLPAFISHVFDVLKKSTTVLFTVDAYGQLPKDYEDVETGLSWHNYWHYGNWKSCAANAASICNDQAAAGKAYLADAAKRDKPALVSEIGQFDCYCPAAHGWQVAGVGFIMWELMLEHDQFSSFQGLVYKNGTWRSDLERDCLKQLSTKKAAACPPRPPAPPPPPPPPPPGWCSASNCTLHADGDSIFTWTPQNDREYSNGPSPFLSSRRSERGRVNSYPSLLVPVD